MARRSKGKEAESLLLVEGKNDQHVFWQLFKHHSIQETFDVEIEGDGGWEAIRASLPGRLTIRNQRRFGIVVDADDDLTSRWQSLRDVCLRTGYSAVPVAPPPDGLIVSPDAAPVDVSEPPFPMVLGIWVMPNNQLPGALEEFVRFLVRPSDTLWPHAESIIAALPGEHEHRTANWNSKARMHTWLAWQRNPGQPMGTAIAERYLDADVPEAQAFIEWVRRLFEIAEGV